MPKIKIPEYIKSILTRLNRNGYESFLVGGCVRDLVMNRRVHDWDVATSAAPAQVMSIFRKTVPTGIKFGTVTVFHKGGQAEITTFRSDGRYSDGRRPESVRFVPSLHDDLARRDFTVNAMAMDVNGEITDLFGGMEDISRKLIRCVGDPDVRFSEDALRMFRAVRFSAQLGFDIEEGAMLAIKSMAASAAALSVERVLSESLKILMSPRPERICAAFNAGLFRSITCGSPDPGAAARISSLPAHKNMRLCAFAVLTEKSHEQGAVLLKQLRAPSAAVRLCRDAGSINCFEAPDIKYALLMHPAESVLCACGINDVLTGSHTLRLARRLIKSGSVIPLAVTGHDLINAGIPSGEHMGNILSMLTRQICEHPEDNSPEILINTALEMYRRGM